MVWIFLRVMEELIKTRLEKKAKGGGGGKILKSGVKTKESPFNFFIQSIIQLFVYLLINVLINLFWIHKH